MVSFGVPFAHRFGPTILRRALVLAIVALGVVMAFFYNQVPFDEKHQKRLFVIHMEDVGQFLLAVVVGMFSRLCAGACLSLGVLVPSLLLTICQHEQLVTQEQHLHVAAADGAPGFHELAHDIAHEFGVDNVLPKAIIMNDYNNDWDALYPFSAVRTLCLCFSSWSLTLLFVV